MKKNKRTALLLFLFRPVEDIYLYLMKTDLQLMGLRGASRVRKSFSKCKITLYIGDFFCVM